MQQHRQQTIAEPKNPRKSAAGQFNSAKQLDGAGCSLHFPALQVPKVVKKAGWALRSVLKGVRCNNSKHVPACSRCASRSAHTRVVAVAQYYASCMVLMPPAAVGEHNSRYCR